MPGLRLALLAGLLLWLSCSPVGLWPLAWVAVAPFLLSVTRARSFRQAAWRGYLFGWVYLGLVWYWIGLTISAWLQGSPLGWAAWFGLTLILAGFYAAWGGVAWWLSRRASGGWLLLGWAAAWVVMEWTRTLGTLTMPWAQLSYTQSSFLPILQFADITGAYGISFLMLLVNGALVLWWQERGQLQSTRWLWATLTLTGFCGLYGLARMQSPEVGKPLRVVALQENTNPLQADPSPYLELENLKQLTQKAFVSPGDRPELYVWPESASPGDAVQNSTLRAIFSQMAQDTHAAHLMGAHIKDKDTQADTNASVLFMPEYVPPRYYSKQQLVPFGEFIPFRNLLPAFLSERFHFFEKDVTPSEKITILSYGSAALGPFICYESMYPRYARGMTRAGANLLVTQSNDAWFQSRAAMEQHLSAVVLRAVENRRQVVRATTSGITCMLDSKGRIVAEAPCHQATFLRQTMQMMEGKTLYTRWGDWFVGLCGLLLLLTAYWKRGAKSE